jgi:hypothetical protein
MDPAPKWVSLQATAILKETCEMAKPNLQPYPISPFEGYDEVTIRCNPYPIRVVALCT